jgi:hypothetical protein
MPGTASNDTQTFRDQLTDELIKRWPDDAPPDQDTLRWAVAEVTKTWVATQARFMFDRTNGMQHRWVVQTPWSTNGIGDS